MPETPALAVFVCHQFTGREGARVGALIVARDRARAAELLNEELQSDRYRLRGDARAADCWEISTAAELVLVIADGSY